MWPIRWKCLHCGQITTDKGCVCRGLYPRPFHELFPYHWDKELQGYIGNDCNVEPYARMYNPGKCDCSRKLSVSEFEKETGVAVERGNKKNEKRRVSSPIFRELSKSRQSMVLAIEKVMKQKALI